MNQTGLVSCIIILLNAERFLEEAIASVFSQSCPNWELILVDDGSNDRSTIIAKECAEKFPKKVHYFEHPNHQNLGMSASRNLGVKQARGEFIAFLDSDDIWLPEKLEQQTAIFRENPSADMVYGRTLIWYSWSQGFEPGLQDTRFELGVQPGAVIQPPKLFPILLRNKHQTPTTCNFMIRRAAYEKLGGFVDDFGGMYEDQAFYVKVFLNLPVYVAEQTWAKYRQHPGSCSAINARTVGYCTGRLNLLSWIEHYLSETSSGQNPRVQEALRKEIWLCKHPALSRSYDFIFGISEAIKSRMAKILQAKKQTTLE